VRRHVSLRNRVAITLSVAGVFACLTVTTAMVDTRPVRVKAHAWVLANGRTLPTTLEALSEYPVEYRREAFQAFAPAQQSAVMREHLAQFVASETLTQQQRAIVARLAEIITPEAYADSGRKAAQAQVKKICQDIQKSFDRRQQALLSTLGPLTPSESRWVKFARTAKAFVGVSTAFAEPTPRARGSCDCHVETTCSGCALGGGNCGGPYPECDSTVGCGCVWINPCDGNCVPLPGGD
jgi:hypothetical protein